MNFIVDTQLPPRLAKFFQSKGFDSLHTTDFEEGHLLKDSEIVQIALEQDRIVVSKDSDFSDRYMIHGAPPKVLLIEFGNIKNSELIQLVDEHFDKILEAFEEGSDLVLFRREEVIGY